MNLLYLLISTIVLLLSTYLFKIASGSLSIYKLNMISYIFYIDIICFSFIGSLLILFKIDNHYLIDYLENDVTRVYGWLAVMYTMLMLPIGIIMSTLLFNKKAIKTTFTRYISKNIVPLLSNNDLYPKLILYSLSVITLLTLIYTFHTIDSIPLFQLFTSDADELNRARIIAGREFSGNQYIRNIFGAPLCQILTFIAYAYSRLSRSILDKLWFLFMFLLSILFLTYDLSKAPVISFILGFVFIKVTIDGGLSKKFFRRIVFFVFLVFIFFYLFLSEDFNIANFLSYNTGIFGRIFLSQIAGLYFNFEIFPSQVDFLGFSSISNVVSNIFSVEHSERSARIIMELINPNSVNEGTAGVMNSLFVGEAWANFGIWGIIFSPLYVGFIIGCLYFLLLRLPKTPIFIGLYTYYCYKSLITGGFNDYLYNIINLTIFLLFLSIVLHILKLKATYDERETDDFSSPISD